MIDSKGTIIKKLSDISNIIYWKQYTNVKGFDYIIYIDDKYGLGFFEAFYPEKSVFFYCLQNSISIDYSDENKCFYIFSEFGLLNTLSLEITSEQLLITE